MRIRVMIDDALLAQALESGEFTSKRSAIEAGLRLLVRIHRQKQLRSLRGKIAWQGDLNAMRRD